MAHALTSALQGRMNRATGPVLMLTAAVLFTLLNFLIKFLDPAFTVWHIVFYRCLGGMILIVLLSGRGNNPFRGKKTGLLMLRGALGSLAFCCLVTAIRLLPLSTAAVIFYAYPAFAALFAYIIYRETLVTGHVICILAVILGVGVLFDFHLTGGLLGQTMAVIAAAFAGLVVTLIRSLRQHNGPVIIYLYFCLMGTVVSFPMYLASPAAPFTFGNLLIIGAMVVTSVSAQVIMNQGFYHCRGWEGGVLMSSEVVFTAIVGILILGDPVSWRFWLGGAMIMGAVFMLSRLGRPPASA